MTVQTRTWQYWQGHELKTRLKVKLLPKCKLGSFCECTRVKRIITKEALLRFTVFSLSGQTHFQWECCRHFYDIIKVPVALTLKPENENTVNLKRAAFIITMLLNEHLTWVHSQKKPRLHFGESFTLSDSNTTWLIQTWQSWYGHDCSGSDIDMSICPQWLVIIATYIWSKQLEHVLHDSDFKNVTLERWRLGARRGLGCLWLDFNTLTSYLFMLLASKCCPCVIASRFSREHTAAIPTRLEKKKKI